MLSSLNLAPTTPLDKQQIRKAKTILQVLLEHNDAYDFKNPVDWKGMNLTDYPTIVKNPMDLGTVQKKLKNEKYKFVEEFFDDIQLIWDNCKLYNLAGSWFYEIAEKIERMFKKLVKNYYPDFHIVVPQKIFSQKSQAKDKYDSFYAEEDITYFEKLNFSEKIQELPSEELQELIEWIREKCPKALSDINEERAQILVDNFTQEQFAQVFQLVKKKCDGAYDKVCKKIKNS